MYKRVVLLILLGILSIVTVCYGCSSIIGIPVETDFSRMLGYIPDSILDEYDIWFGNPGQTLDYYGVPYLESSRELKKLSDEDKALYTQAYIGTGIGDIDYGYPDLYAVIGFDWTSIHRFLWSRIRSTRESDVSEDDRFEDMVKAAFRKLVISEGVLDEDKITENLVTAGYTVVADDSRSYFTYDPSEFPPIGRYYKLTIHKYAERNFRNIALFDDTMITSTEAADITSVFDTLNGEVRPAIDNKMVRALADSLGEVLKATITTPERIIYSRVVEDSPIHTFDFTVPRDWRILRGYDMAALGYRVEGENRYVDIALYYNNARKARDDGILIYTRMQSYLLQTFIPHGPEPCKPFTEAYFPGKPVVKKYFKGAVVKIICQLISDEPWLPYNMIGREWDIRDLLFLVPDPAPYIGKPEVSDLQ